MSIFTLENMHPTAKKILVEYHSEEKLKEILEFLQDWEYFCQYPTGYAFKAIQKEGKFKPKFKN